MLSRGHKANRTANGGAAAADTESLQTDVMRFVAIIGLCLTAIFSLMRSIAEPAKNEAELVEARELQQQIVSLKKELDQQSLSKQTLRNELINSQEQLQHADEQEHALQQLRIRLSKLTQAMANKHQEQKQLEQTLAASADENRQLKMQLKDTQQKTMPAPRQRLVVQQEKQPAADKPPQPKQAEPLEPDDSAAIIDIPAPPKQQGFALKFASEKALNELIRSGQVKLLAVADHQAWRLNPLPQPAFHKIPMPGKYYEMLPDTLPMQYRHSFNTSSNRSTPMETVWAVQIPVSTEHEIQRLLKSVSGGDLVIQNDGSVDYQSGADT